MDAARDSALISRLCEEREGGEAVSSSGFWKSVYERENANSVTDTHDLPVDVSIAL